jgi:translocation and assembly module TamB
MRSFWTILALILWAVVAAPGAFAQEDDRERGLLQGFIEDNLSDVGRDVRITGFRGALSSQASLEELTIADGEGVWLTLRDVTLDWTRSALLRGRLEVNRLTAAEIIMPRQPVPEGGLEPEDAVARPFALPELPVAVNIGQISIELVDLGAPVLGEAVALSMQGAVSLDAGDGAADLEVTRLDGDGGLRLNASYSNETRILAVDLDVTEGPGGIVAGLMNLPGRPALGLKVAGEAPLDDYEARLTLLRNEVPRLTGTLRLQGDPETGARRFEARLGGDVRPFFTPELQGFFGDRSQLRLIGQTRPEGGTVIEDVTLATERLHLKGALELDSAGWPVRVTLDGGLDAGGALLRLPVAGPPTRLRRADLSARYDAAEGQGWQASAVVDELQREGLRIAEARLEGRGQILRGEVRSLVAELDFGLRGFVDQSDAALSEAVGATPEGRLEMRWQEGAALEITRLDVSSGNAELRAMGELDGLGEGFPLRGRATLRAADLGRFAGLAGRDLAGRIDTTVQGQGTLLGGAFDLALEAETEALALGVARLDPVLAPQTRLRATARRDETGTVLDRLQIWNSALEADLSGRLDAQSGALDLAVALSEVGLVEPRLDGPARIEGGLGWTSGGALVLEDLRGSVAGAEFQATGRISPEDVSLPVDGRVSLTAPDLSRFARLVGRPIAGRIELSADGEGQIRGDTGRFDLSLDGRDLRSGIAELDRLIEGRMSAALKVRRQDARIVLDVLNVESGRVSLSARGSQPGAPITVNGRLDDLALLAPGFSGPVEAAGQIILRDETGRDIGVDLGLTGPGGTTATLTGSIADLGQRLALKASGTLPLGLANAFIAPRSVSGTARYDLSIDGAAALSSVSGRIDLSDGQVSLPTLNSALDNLTGRITLSGANAGVELSAQGRGGGTVGVSGTVGLSAPYPADLGITLASVVHSDPDLYRTEVSGRLGLNGPLTGAAQLRGELVLGQTEIRVPTSMAANVGLLPQIRHINPPAYVTETRRRAGLVAEQESDPGPGIGLDITISAPNRIFVRGRGLDAELGGRLRVQGTTTNVIPSGTFQLQRGRLDILGQRLTLTSGVIDLRGAFDPYLEFIAETDVEDMTVQVIIRGLASAPEIIFSSSPELPQEEVVSRLIFGRGIDDISPFQAAQLAAAVATLTGGLDGGLFSGVRNALGLSNLDVTSTADGATAFTAGAYISENVYSEVTADSAGNQKIDLNLDLSRSVTVRGSVGTDGDTGVGIFFERDY